MTMSDPKPCESCGRCPTCGRGVQTQPYMPVYPAPYYPYTTPFWGPTWISTTGVSTSTFTGTGINTGTVIS